MAEESFDVFISYGHQDRAWVDALAENLHRAGLDVFLDKWEIAPGDVVVHQLERGLLNSRNGVLVISPASVERPWVQQEYAVMVSRAVEGTQRLIPVLLGDIAVPLFAATRLWVDFRRVDGPEYERRVEELAAALRGERPQRPPRGVSFGLRLSLCFVRREHTGRPCGSTQTRPSWRWRARRRSAAARAGLATG